MAHGNPNNQDKNLTYANQFCYGPPKDKIMSKPFEIEFQEKIYTGKGIVTVAGDSANPYLVLEGHPNSNTKFLDFGESYIHVRRKIEDDGTLNPDIAVVRLQGIRQLLPGLYISAEEAVNDCQKLHRSVMDLYFNDDLVPQNEISAIKNSIKRQIGQLSYKNPELNKQCEEILTAVTDKKYLSALNKTMTMVENFKPKISAPEPVSEPLKFDRFSYMPRKMEPLRTIQVRTNGEKPKEEFVAPVATLVPVPVPDPVPALIPDTIPDPNSPVPDSISLEIPEQTPDTIPTPTPVLEQKPAPEPLLKPDKSAYTPRNLEPLKTIPVHTGKSGKKPKEESALQVESLTPAPLADLVVTPAPIPDPAVTSAAPTLEPAPPTYLKPDRLAYTPRKMAPLKTIHTQAANGNRCKQGPVAALSVETPPVEKKTLTNGHEQAAKPKAKAQIYLQPDQTMGTPDGPLTCKYQDGKYVLILPGNKQSGTSEINLENGKFFRIKEIAGEEITIETNSKNYLVPIYYMIPEKAQTLLEKFVSCTQLILLDPQNKEHRENLEKYADALLEKNSFGAIDKITALIEYRNFMEAVKIGCAILKNDPTSKAMRYTERRDQKISLSPKDTIELRQKGPLDQLINAMAALRNSKENYAENYEVVCVIYESLIATNAAEEKFLTDFFDMLSDENLFRDQKKFAEALGLVARSKHLFCTQPQPAMALENH